MNKYLIPAINKKWKDVDISSDEVSQAKYDKEVVSAFNEALNTVGNYSFYNSPSGELMIGFSSNDELGMPAMKVYSKNKRDIRRLKESDAYERGFERWNNDMDKLSDEFFANHNLPSDYNLNKNPKLLAEYDDFIMNEKFSEYINDELSKVH